MGLQLYGLAGAEAERPDLLLPIVPEWVPWPRQVVMATGLCEIAGALGLWVIRFRVTAGILLALYALCVWPANFKHAFGHVMVPGIPDSWWYHGPRLLLQPVLIWCALYCSGAVNWPFSERP
jgi:uncharacterized membrane protein